MTTNKTNITIDMLNTMSGQEFEELTADLFKKMGYLVQTTAKTGDGGIDVKAINNDELTRGLYIIQCKRYSNNKIGIDEVQRLYGVVKAENAIKGIFATTSNYTKKAEEFSEENNIELINGTRFISLIHKFINDADSKDLENILKGKIKYPGKTGKEIINEIQSKIVFKKKITTTSDLIKITDSAGMAISEIVKGFTKNRISNDIEILKISLQKAKVIYKRLAEIDVDMSYCKKHSEFAEEKLVEIDNKSVVFEKINVYELDRYFKTISKEAKCIIMMTAEGIRGNQHEYSKHKDEIKHIEMQRKNIRIIDKITKDQSSCYIATYCYGKDSKQYHILCSYRDNVLNNNLFGRQFVKIYYKISPMLIHLFGKSKCFKLIFRKLIRCFINLISSFVLEDKT